MNLPGFSKELVNCIYVLTGFFAIERQKARLLWYWLKLALTPICLVNRIAFRCFGKNFVLSFNCSCLTGGAFMSYAILEKYNILTDELKSEVNDFIDFLLRKNTSNPGQFSNNIVLSKTSPSATLKKIQSLFEEDKGWNSESEMIEDMRQFRQSRAK